MATGSFAPGKIILAGEYAVVFGYPGLAIPAKIGITAMHTSETESHGTRPMRIDWPEAPALWIVYLERIIAECERIAGKSFAGTLAIQNDLPLGRGMGSSTALVIAVARCLLGKDCEQEAKRVEDTVSPGNSGLDFAVIWQNKALRFQKEKPSSSVEIIDPLLKNAVLIDTDAPNETTAELVAWIKDRHHTAPDTIDQTLSIIGACADRLIGGESPLTVFPDHHRAQMELGVVPPKTAELIVSIEKSGGSAKVIGAGARTGGGGMVLAVHPEPSALAQFQVL
jgi:mevalonate kinase